jgi:hypothetical protein
MDKIRIEHDFVLVGLGELDMSDLRGAMIKYGDEGFTFHSIIEKKWESGEIYFYAVFTKQSTIIVMEVPND